MTKTITIREYGRIIKGKPETENNTDNCCYVDEETFNNLRDFAMENQEEDSYKALTYQVKKRQEIIGTKNYVGLIETRNGTTIEILPKIYGKESDVESTRQTFLKMLSCLKDSPFISLNEAQLKTARFPLFEIFISAFLKEVEVLIQQGLKKHYVNVQENQKFLKGKLLFNENTRYNAIHKERFYVEYQDFITDIPQNRLIKSTLLYLSKKAKSSANQNRIRQFIFTFDEIPSSVNIDKDFQHALTGNRLFLHYTQALSWAKVFLNKQAFTNFKGNSLNKAILFPMEKIFEAYFTALLKKHLTGYEVHSQDKTYYLVDDHHNSKKFNLRPDIVIKKDEKVHFILDTKWKLLNQEDSRNNYNISQADMYQLYAYGKKYGIENQKPKLILVYPQNDNFTKNLNFIYETELHLEVVPFDLGDQQITGFKKYIK